VKEEAAMVIFVLAVGLLLLVQLVFTALVWFNLQAEPGRVV